MLYVTRRIKNDNWGIMDTDDGVEEIYPAEKLLSIGVEIRGVDRVHNKVYSVSKEYFRRKVNRYKLAGWLPADVKYEVCSLVDIAEDETDESIGMYITSAHAELKILRIPEGAVFFGLDDSLVFRENTSIKQVILPKSLRCLYVGSLSDLYVLEEVNFPKDLRELSYACFCCSGIMEVDLSGTAVEEIGDACFDSCARLRKVILPKALKWKRNPYITDSDGWGDRCFQYCRALEEVVFTGHLDAIDKCAFKNSGLKILVLPYGLKHIRSDSLAELKRLSDIYCRGNQEIADRLSRDFKSLGVSDRIKIHVG